MTKAVLVYQIKTEDEPRIEKFTKWEDCHAVVKYMVAMNKTVDTPMFINIMWNKYNDK